MIFVLLSSIISRISEVIHFFALLRVDVGSFVIVVCICIMLAHVLFVSCVVVSCKLSIFNNCSVYSVCNVVFYCVVSQTFDLDVG